MIRHIYKKIAADSCGDSETMYAYAAYLEHRLHETFPGASIAIETTERESGVMPTQIEADTGEEEEAVRDCLHQSWDDFCGQA